jgi:hypothetical protein
LVPQYNRIQVNGWGNTQHSVQEKMDTQHRHKNRI